MTERMERTGQVLVTSSCKHKSLVTEASGTTLVRKAEGEVFAVDKNQQPWDFHRTKTPKLMPATIRSSWQRSRTLQVSVYASRGALGFGCPS